MHTGVLPSEVTAGKVLPRVVLPLDRTIRIAFWFVALLLGFLQAWDNRHVMNSDGICYLDLADAYLRGGWKMLLNAHWSPFYPWLLAVAKWIFRPSAYWEFTTVHLVHLGIYAAAAATFELMLGEFIADRGLENARPLPSWALRTIGYLVFLWLTLTLITLERKSPDMLMSIFVYLAVALVWRIRRTGGNWTLFCLLGVVLGFGYLAKTPMFPLAFVFVGCTLFAAGNAKRTALGAAVALAIFLLISAPLVVGLSRLKGRLTFGDSGRWNYLTEIDGAGPVWYMQDVGTARGGFVHPPQKIFNSPAVYAFEGPVGGTLPVWYDPSYWIEGATPRLNLAMQRTKTVKNAGLYVDLLFSREAALLALFLALCWFGDPRAVAARMWQRWPAWLPAVAALFMYLVVLVQERYVAVFLIVVWVALFSSVLLPHTNEGHRFAVGSTFALLFALGVPLLLSAGHDFLAGVVHHQEHEQWEFAQQLRRMGVQPGDLVGRIGGLHRVEWARLLRVRVIAEIPRAEAEDFWSSSPEVKEQVMESFHKVGAKAVIAEQIPPWEVFTPANGWARIGESRFFVNLAGRSESAAQATPRTEGQSSRH